MTRDHVAPAAALCALALVFTAVASARPAAHAKTTRVAVTAGKPSEFAFTLSKKSVPVGRVVFTVANKGKIAHTFKVCSSPSGGKANACKGKGTKLISPATSAKLTIVFAKQGRYEYLCTVPGHAAAGMKGVLKVT